MRARALVLLLLLAVQGAAGATPPGKPWLTHDDLEVRALEGFAQVREALGYTGPRPEADLPLPPGARDVQAFVVGPGGPVAAPWRWLGEGRLAVWVGNATGEAPVEVLLLYTRPLAPTGLTVAFPGPAARERATLRAVLPEGWQARADGALLARDADGAWTGSWDGSPAAVPEVALGPPPAPSPVPVLGALLGLVFLGTMVRARTARGAAPRADMGLLDHLRDLQGRLRVVLLAVAVLMVALFTVALVPMDVGGLEVPVPVPSLTDNLAAQTFRLLAAQFVPPGVQLVVVDPISGALVQVEVALFLALLVASPLIGYQAGAFLMPALLPHERRLLLRAIPAATALFVAGAVFAYVVMVPTMMRVLYSYAQGLGAVSFIAVSNLVSFAVIVTLIFGASFELPILMVALAKLGVVAPRTMAAKWRHVVVALFVLAAVITPDPSVVSQLLVALPLLGLYALGLVAAHVAVRAPAAAAAPATG